MMFQGHHYPDGTTYADLVRAGIEGAGEPADVSDATRARVIALVDALTMLDAACRAMIDAGELFPIGDLHPDEWRPSALPTRAQALAQAQTWADQQADAEAEYITEEDH